MTDTQANLYQGDPNMLIELHSIEDQPFDQRTLNCLANDNIFFLGQLLTKTEANLLQTPNFGRKSLNKIKAFLAHVSKNTPNFYALGTINHDFGYKDKASMCQAIIEYFDIKENNTPPLSQEKTTERFSADDFEITETGNDGDSVHFSIKLKDTEKHEAWDNLCADRYVTLRSNPDEAGLEDEQTFLQRTFADAVVYSSDSKDITLHYDKDSSSLTKLATINVLECFADAVNDIIPRAQQRALDGFEKRYGIKQPKNG